uniref:F-box domain-containing protein n=1 Tax=Parastrongyloides trichosuri TaxID=131310 RepID=A0A0N4Z5Z2_PARTI
MWCKIETLKPTTMLLCVRSLKEEIVEEFDIKIPDSVSNVYLASAPSEYKAILSVFKNSNKKKFNKLVSKIDIDELDMGQNIFKEIISCFRETTIILNDCFNEYPSNYCKDVFSRCEFLYHPNITLEQLYEIRWDSFNNVFETFQEEKIPIIHNNDLIRLGYLLMKSLKMDSCNDENRALTRTEFYHFKNDLSRMCNLQTLCLDFNVMKGLRRFETICSSINYNLENLELFGCTDIKKIHLDILSKYCEKIKNLSIYTITSNTVRIKDIIKNFKHLEGLYLHFDDSYNVKNILKDLKTKLVTKGEYKLRWPRLKFLFITCPVPNEWGMKIIKSMDMNTQRKSGKFILEQFTNTRKYDEYKIIIQESSLFFSKFLKIFSSDIPLTMRDYYFY